MSDTGPVPPPTPGAPAAAPPPAFASPEAPAARWWTLAAVAGVVCWRCAGILTVLAVPLALVGLATGGGVDVLPVVALVWVVHLLVLAVVGYPLGLVLARFVPLTSTRTAAAGWYALAGALPGLALLPLMGAAALIWVGLGAAVAGTARTWAHPALVARYGG